MYKRSSVVTNKPGKKIKQVNEGIKKQTKIFNE